MNLKKITNTISKLSIIEYLFYFILASLFSYFSYLSIGIFGIEHVLSAWKTSLGNAPYVDFFEHHGPLQYYLFAPFFYISEYKFFHLFLILVNSCISVLAIHYLFSLFKFSLNKRLIISSIFIWTWTLLFGASFLPEPYISLFVIAIYFIFKKIKNNRIYLIFLGFFAGLVFLIKFNAFILILFGIFLYYALNLKRELSSINFLDFFYFLSGLITPLLFVVVLYYKKFSEVIYWMFDYNFNVVTPLTKKWPQGQEVSLFFLILIFNIFVLCLIFLNKKYKEKYYQLSFPILISTCLVMLSYPLYGDSHLLVAIIGFFVSILLFFREKFYKIISFNNFTYEFRFINIIMFFVFFVIFILICTSLFSLAKKSFRLFWPLPEAFYSAEFDKQAIDYIENEESCSYVYVYPADVSNLSMYLSLKQVKSIKFSYPNWTHTFTEKMQKMILQELIEKKVDCVLVKNEFLENSLRSEIIERYLLEKYSKKEKVIWREYGMSSLLPLNFIIKNNLNVTNIDYVLLKLN